MTPSEQSNSERTPAFWRERLEARPLPGDAPPPWAPDAWKDASGYEGAAECLAHALLVLAEERPELLRFEDTDDAWERADNRKLWDAAEERWPGLDDWLGGITGFQFGWAHNMVRFVVGVDAVGNPAIVTISGPEE